LHHDDTVTLLNNVYVLAVTDDALFKSLFKQISVLAKLVEIYQVPAASAEVDLTNYFVIILILTIT